MSLLKYSLPWVRVRGLIVAEKGSVARAVAKFLGGRYTTRRIYGVPVYYFNARGKLYASIGLKGHLFDFDFEDRYNHWYSVEPGDLFNITPLLKAREDCVKYIHALRRVGSNVDEVALALDADAEGEAIAYEAYLVLKQVNPSARFYRVRFNAVTKRDIERAFSNPSTIDLRQVEKVFSRMILDLTIGAVFTRLLTLTVTKYDRSLLDRGSFLSYGPCQTPVLRLVVDRALKREEFKPSKYYVVNVVLRHKRGVIRASPRTKFEDKNSANLFASRIEELRRGVVKRVVRKEVLKDPPKPLDTVELERRASRFYNIRSKTTMYLAEELYRRGYISYPRTETTIYPPTLNLREVLEELRQLGGDLGQYAENLLNKPQLRPTRGSTDDRAHPPIYPTAAVDKNEVKKALGSRGNLAWKIYELVVRHFLATLSSPARITRKYIIVEFDGAELTAEGVEVVDPGYWTIYYYEREEERPLPDVEEGEELLVERVVVEERETEPPPYLSESELLALMRKYGIGTDATMQDHIHTNVVRKYMVINRGRCVPTELGKSVILALKNIAPELVDPTVRARMERSLQRIAQGVEIPSSVIKEVVEEFSRYYARVVEKRDLLLNKLVQALRSTQTTDKR